MADLVPSLSLALSVQLPCDMQHVHSGDQRGAGEHDDPIARRELHPAGQPGQLQAFVRDQHVRRRDGHGVPAGRGRAVDPMRREERRREGARKLKVIPDAIRACGRAGRVSCSRNNWRRGGRGRPVLPTMADSCCMCPLSLVSIVVRTYILRSTMCISSIVEREKKSSCLVLFPCSSGGYVRVVLATRACAQRKFLWVLLLTF